MAFLTKCCSVDKNSQVRMSGLHQPPGERVGNGEGKFDFILGAVARSVPILLGVEQRIIDVLGVGLSLVTSFSSIMP